MRLNREIMQIYSRLLKKRKTTETTFSLCTSVKFDVKKDDRIDIHKNNRR
jgi:hypothetical protein